MSEKLKGAPEWVTSFFGKWLFYELVPRAEAFAVVEALARMLEQERATRGAEEDGRCMVYSKHSRIAALEQAKQLALAEPRVFEPEAPDPQHRIAAKIQALIDEVAK